MSERVGKRARVQLLSSFCGIPPSSSLLLPCFHHCQGMGSHIDPYNAHASLILSVSLSIPLACLLPIYIYPSTHAAAVNQKKIFPSLQKPSSLLTHIHKQCLCLLLQILSSSSQSLLFVTFVVLFSLYIVYCCSCCSISVLLFSFSFIKTVLTKCVHTEI